MQIYRIALVVMLLVLQIDLINGLSIVKEHLHRQFDYPQRHRDLLDRPTIDSSEKVSVFKLKLNRYHPSSKRDSESLFERPKVSATSNHKLIADQVEGLDENPEFTYITTESVKIMTESSEIDYEQSKWKLMR